MGHSCRMHHEMLHVFRLHIYGLGCGMSFASCLVGVLDDLVHILDYFTHCCKCDAVLFIFLVILIIWFTFIPDSCEFNLNLLELVSNAVGQLMLMVVNWNPLDIRRVIELIWTFQKAHGQMLPAFMIF